MPESLWSVRPRTWIRLGRAQLTTPQLRLTKNRIQSETFEKFKKTYILVFIANLKPIKNLFTEQL